MNNLPDNVLGVIVEGKITGTDYKAILIPAIEGKLKAHKKIRMIYNLGKSFTGADLGAIADDTEMGLKHFFVWDRIALVSDHHLINTVAKYFGYLFSCELRIFKDDELGDAIKWISEKK